MGLVFSLSHVRKLLSYLQTDLKEMIQAKYLKEDVVAGVTVAFIALPLSLAIALASGVSPGHGLITAIVGGIVCALFGGTQLGVSGPAAAMAVLIASVVETHGMSGLLIVGLGVGVLQILSGVLGVGQLARFVPVPVIAGFTAGIGAIILLGQLPRALGLPAPDQSHIFDILTHIYQMFGEAKMHDLALALFSLGLCVFVPKVFPRLPAPFLAVLFPTLLGLALSWPVQMIGSIPDSLPMPKLPGLPQGNHLQLLFTTFVVFALASLETLLSAQALDKLSKGRRHLPDLELVGQGMGNLASAFFGGIPVTNVIARSTLNITAGGKTRRSAIIHALCLMMIVFFLAPIVGKIPIAVLAGILISVALRMLHPKEFLDLWWSSRVEVITFFITFLTIIFVDLIAGVQAGIVVAMLIALFRIGQSKSMALHNSDNGPYHLTISGPLSFLSSAKIEKLRDDFSRIDEQRPLILNLSEVSSLDFTSAAALSEIIDYETTHRDQFCLVAPQPQLKKILFSLDHMNRWEKVTVTNESEIEKILPDISLNHPLHRLVLGVNRFRQEVSESHYGEIFSKLADVQNPHTLFITCSDSRINPNLITATRPGELFLVRNVGNIIPSFNTDLLPAEGAAIEFAVGVLGIKNIIICAHSNCGAMKEMMSGAIFSPEKSKRFPSVARWLKVGQEIRQELPPGSDHDHAACLNARKQIENVRTYPIVQEKMALGEIKIHAWFYDIGKAELKEWNKEKNDFISI